MWLTAWRNLSRFRGRTLLTLLGVGGSVSLYVTLAAVSHAYRTQLDDTLARCHVDVVVQSRAAASITGSRLLPGDLEVLRRLDGVAEVTPLVVGSVKSGVIPYVLVFGVETLSPLTQVSDWLGVGMIAGRPFAGGRQEVLVGQKLARKYKLAVGDPLPLGGVERYRVSGIYDLGLDFLDGAVLADLSLVQHMLGRGEDYNLALVRLEVQADSSQLLISANAALPHLSAVPGDDLRSRIRAISLIDGFILAVTTIALLLSGLIVLNTLVMSLAERTGEIGILMVVGWSRWMIIQMVLAEALLLCLGAGFMGFSLSWAILPLLDSLPQLGAGWLPASPPWYLLPHALGLAIGTGLISALYPAFYSTRLPPVLALRDQ